MPPLPLGFVNNTDAAAPNFANQIAADEQRFNDQMQGIYQNMEQPVIRIQEKHLAYVAGEMLRAAFDKGYDYYKSWRDYLTGNNTTSEQKPVEVRKKTTRGSVSRNAEPDQKSPQQPAVVKAKSKKLDRARRRNDGDPETSTITTIAPSASSSQQPSQATADTTTTTPPAGNSTASTGVPTFSPSDFSVVKPHYDRLADLYKTNPAYSGNPFATAYITLYNHIIDNYQFAEAIPESEFGQLNNVIEQINYGSVTTTTGGPRAIVDSQPWIELFDSYNNIIGHYTEAGKNPAKNAAFEDFRDLSFEINDDLRAGNGLTQAQIDAYNNAFFSFESLPDVAPTITTTTTSSTVPSTTSSTQSSTNSTTSATSSTTAAPSPTVAAAEVSLYRATFTNFRNTFIALGYNTGIIYTAYNALYNTAFSSGHSLTVAEVDNLNNLARDIQQEHSVQTTTASPDMPISQAERAIVENTVTTNEGLIASYIHDHPNHTSQAFEDFRAEHIALRSKLFPLQGNATAISQQEVNHYLSLWESAFINENTVNNGTANASSNGGLNYEGSIGVPFATFVAGGVVGAVIAIAACRKRDRARVANVGSGEDTVYRKTGMPLEVVSPQTNTASSPASPFSAFPAAATPAAHTAVTEPKSAASPKRMPTNTASSVEETMFPRQSARTAWGGKDAEHLGGDFESRRPAPSNTGYPPTRNFSGHESAATPSHVAQPVPRSKTGGFGTSRKPMAVRPDEPTELPSPFTSAHSATPTAPSRQGIGRSSSNTSTRFEVPPIPPHTVRRAPTLTATPRATPDNDPSSSEV